MTALSELTFLEVLDLSKTSMDDQQLGRLHGLRGLQQIHLFDTPRVTQRGLDDLRRAIPKMEVLGPPDNP